MSSNEISTEMNKEVNKGGPPFSDIWNHMKKGPKQSKGRYSATCNYCAMFWKNGKPFVLREHLANHCKKCPNDIIMYYTSCIEKVIGKKIVKVEDSDSNSERPNKKIKQTAVSNFFESTKLEKGRIEEIDRAITKAFIMCNIPFNVIENLWFIDLIKTLQPAYNAPSRRILSGSFLQVELARINIKIHNELISETEFTIGKNFIIIYN